MFPHKVWRNLFLKKHFMGDGGQVMGSCCTCAINDQTMPRGEGGGEGGSFTNAFSGNPKL